MAGELDGRRVATLTADGVERVELEQLRRALKDTGSRTEVVSITGGGIQARDHDLADAGTFAVDRLVGAAAVEVHDTLLLPGGTVNPDELRMVTAGHRGATGADGVTRRGVGVRFSVRTPSRPPPGFEGWPSATPCCPGCSAPSSSLRRSTS